MGGFESLRLGVKIFDFNGIVPDTIKHIPMTAFTQSRLTPMVLLAISNVFMTFAWYAHLNYSQLKGGAPALPISKCIVPA